VVEEGKLEKGDLAPLAAGFNFGTALLRWEI
jgi:hypothetical protein